MVDTTIAVAATKKKRGRPKAFNWLDDAGEGAKVLRAVATHGASNRVSQHRLYVYEALAALRDESNEPNPRYAWLDTDKKTRVGALVEIGRLAVAVGHDEARNFADWLMERVEAGDITTTREAERWLRANRLDFLAWRARPKP